MANSVAQKYNLQNIITSQDLSSLPFQYDISNDFSLIKQLEGNCTFFSLHYLFYQYNKVKYCRINIHITVGNNHRLIENQYFF